MSGKNFACVRKLGDIWKNILICPEKFLVDPPREILISNKNQVKRIVGQTNTVPPPLKQD
jgi:hypothetical protein